MFNRLPIYTRPKEPAIGYPTLTESTNTNLTGQILGLDGGPIPPQSTRGNSYSFGNKTGIFKGLPDIPNVDTSLRDDYEKSEEDDIRPPAPLKTRHPNSSVSPTSVQITIEHMNNIHPLQRKGVQRKPAPANNPGFSLIRKPSSESIWGKSSVPGYNSAQTTSRRGFGFGSVVKEKVTGRRRPVDAPSYSSEPSGTLDPLETQSPIALVKPPNFVSIDDWLDTREGLHQRSNTVTTVSTVATRYNDPTKLQIRQSAFAPLQTPHELVPPQRVPTLPKVPSQYNTSVPKITTPTPPPQLTQRPPSPPKTPPKVDPQPRDHIEQLEFEQEHLASRKTDIRREMWDLQQLLSPNPSTHNPMAREDMNKRLAELVQELADVEKEVHDTGMKLHRAWRRRDKKMGVEGPTHLWVSRAIGP